MFTTAQPPGNVFSRVDPLGCFSGLGHGLKAAWLDWGLCWPVVVHGVISQAWYVGAGLAVCVPAAADPRHNFSSFKAAWLLSWGISVGGGPWYCCTGLGYRHRDAWLTRGHAYQKQPTGLFLRGTKLLDQARAMSSLDGPWAISQVWDEGVRLLGWLRGALNRGDPWNCFSGPGHALLAAWLIWEHAYQWWLTRLFLRLLLGLQGHWASQGCV